MAGFTSFAQARLREGQPWSRAAREVGSFGLGLGRARLWPRPFGAACLSKAMLQTHRGISFSAARAKPSPGGQTFSGSAMLELEFAELSDPGKVREHNEDFLVHATPATIDEARALGWLFALADGVGGQD